MWKRPLDILLLFSNMQYQSSGFIWCKSKYLYFRNSLHPLPLPQISAGKVTAKSVSGEWGGGEDILQSFLHLLPCPLLLPPSLRSHLWLQHWDFPRSIHALHRSHHIPGLDHYGPCQVPLQKVRQMLLPAESLLKPVFIRSDTQTKRTEGREEDIVLLTKTEKYDCKKSLVHLADEKNKGDCKCP